MVDIRKSLTDQLKALTPKRWVFIPYASDIEPPKNPTVMLILTGYKPQTNAGINTRMRMVTYDLLLIEPTQAPGKSDDALDDELISLLEAIDSVPGLSWESADRKADPSGQYPAYVVSLTFEHNTY